MACIPFPNGQSQKRVQEADLVKFLPNPRTKLAESPIVNSVILDFVIIVHMLPPKLGHLGRVLQCYICALCQKTAGICKQSSPCQGRSLKKLTTEEMSMKNLWLRQLVHDWVQKRKNWVKCLGWPVTSHDPACVRCVCCGLLETICAEKEKLWSMPAKSDSFN